MIKTKKRWKRKLRQFGLTLVWCLAPMTLIFWMSSSHESDNEDVELKFTGIDIGWQGVWSW